MSLISAANDKSKILIPSSIVCSLLNMRTLPNANNKSNKRPPGPRRSVINLCDDENDENTDSDILIERNDVTKRKEEETVAPLIPTSVHQQTPTKPMD